MDNKCYVQSVSNCRKSISDKALDDKNMGEEQEVEREVLTTNMSLLKYFKMNGQKVRTAVKLFYCKYCFFHS